ncbi:hypothetical protein LCL95_01030 [Bacillus timonensis]|nr:hypothetical protein [Bacillus timonensis]
MFIILVLILLVISTGCYMESKSKRKGMKYGLSLTLSVIFPLIVEGSFSRLVEDEMLQGTFYIISYISLPTIAFFLFQLLLHEIRLFHK